MGDLEDAARLLCERRLAGDDDGDQSGNSRKVSKIHVNSHQPICCRKRGGLLFLQRIYREAVFPHAGLLARFKTPADYPTKAAILR